MLREKPEPAGDGVFRLNEGLTLRVTGSEKAETEITELPVTDPRLGKSYPGSLWRLALTFEAATDFRIRMQLR